jgi:hypothetical protein
MHVRQKARHQHFPHLVYHRGSAARAALQGAQSFAPKPHREVIMEGIALLVGPSLVVFGALAWVMSLFKEQAALDAERDHAEKG